MNPFLNCKLLLFDLDGTLLNSEKTISPLTLDTLDQCREIGLLIGVSTSRSQQNSLKYIAELPLRLSYPAAEL